LSGGELEGRLVERPSAGSQVGGERFGFREEFGLPAQLLEEAAAGTACQQARRLAEHGDGVDGAEAGIGVKGFRRAL
jgi:hypothetical protein